MTETIPLKIKRQHNGIFIPTKSTPNSAAYDIYCPQAVKWILPGDTYMMKLGFQLEIPEGYKVEIYSRSGLASKGLFVINQPGKVDSDYRGEICVLLHNASKWRHFEFNPGDRVAQMEIAPTYNIDFEEVVEVEETIRGEGGFGSTGK